MFNADFYPTHNSLIEKMLAPFLGERIEQKSDDNYVFRHGRERGAQWQNVQLLGMTILEPSAGKGNILDFIKTAFDERLGHYGQRESSNYGRRLYAIESEPELVAILQQKNYRVIGNDFLEYAGNRAFDLIIANPPFSNGAKHVLKMWDIVAPGGHIVSLINAESLRNEFSEERQLLGRLIADHGSVEELGSPFEAGDEVERKTGVHVSLIRLQKPAEADGSRFDFNFESRRKKQRPITEDTLFDAPARRDLVGNMMVGFEQVQDAFLDYIKARKRLQFFGSDLKEMVDGQTTDVLKMAEEAISGKGSNQSQFNEFSDTVQQQLWRVLLGKLDIQQLLTEKVQRDFHTYSEKTGYLDFSKPNVASVIELLMNNRGNILEQAIEAVFDIFTKNYRGNRMIVQGWATNSAWKVNRKIILPYWVRWNDHSPKWESDEFRLNWSCQSEYDDIDKALCYITGRNYKTVTTVAQALEYKFRRLGRVGSGAFDGTAQSTFFKLKFHKSGTLHITFLDEKLWEEFNLRACAGKMWLPGEEQRAYEKRTSAPFGPPPVAPEPEPEAPPVPKMLAVPQPVVVVEPVAQEPAEQPGPTEDTTEVVAAEVVAAEVVAAEVVAAEVVAAEVVAAEVVAELKAMPAPKPTRARVPLQPGLQLSFMEMAA